MLTPVVWEVLASTDSEIEDFVDRARSGAGWPELRREDAESAFDSEAERNEAIEELAHAWVSGHTDAEPPQRG